MGENQSARKQTNNNNNNNQGWIFKEIQELKKPVGL